MLTIHGVPISVHTRKAIVTAVLKGIDHEVEPVIPFNPPENWTELSPTGLIPALSEGDFSLADSTAICLYFEQVRPRPALLPEEARARARTLWFDGYAGGTVFRNLIHGIFFQKIIRPNILGEEGDPTVIDRILSNVQPKIFAYLDSQATGDFLVGDQLTLADIAIASNLINHRYLGLTIDAACYPDLARYADGIIGQPAFRQALAAERPFAEQMGLALDWIAPAVHAAKTRQSRDGGVARA